MLKDHHPPVMKELRRSPAHCADESEHSGHDDEEEREPEEPVQHEPVDDFGKVHLRLADLHDVADKSCDDAVPRFGEFDVRRIRQDLRHAPNRAFDHFRCHVVIVDEGLSDKRFPFQRLDRHPSRRNLQRLGRLDRARRENVDFLLKLVAIVDLERGNEG